MDILKKEVLKLLKSDISAYRISKDTGVSESVVKKLRNQNQQLEDTKYETVNKLYTYALQNQAKIREDDLKDIKLPKTVHTFIEQIASRIESINHKGAVKNVYVFDKYHMDDNGNSENKNTFIEINETMSLPLQYNYNDEVPYQVNIKKEINSKNNIDSIRGMKLLFKKDELIRDLKIHIKNGSKVKMKASDNKFSLIRNNTPNKGIYINDIFNNSEVYNYEASYFDFTFNNQIDTGNFPITLIKNEQTRLLLAHGMSDRNSNATMLVGKDNNDNPVTIDLEKEPHLLVGGSIGSGVNKAMDYLITSLLWCSDIERLQTAFIDINGVDFDKYENNPFNMTKVIKQKEEAKSFIEKIYGEAEQRLKKIDNDMETVDKRLDHKHGENANHFNKETIMKRTFVFISVCDELLNDAIIEKKIRILINMGKLHGIHIILIYNNLSSATDIRGVLRGFMPNRLSYKVNNQIISRMILGENGAEDLAGEGQGIITNTNKNNSELVQTPYISDEETENIVTYMNQNMLVEGDDNRGNF